MPAISKIRLTNVVYEEGNKRYNDELFLFDGHNGAILLENGGGKTVFIQTALQAILPHAEVADRKIKNTLLLEIAPAHIAIEWITSEQPRRYVVTAVSLFMTKHGLDSLRYVYEYPANDANAIEGIPFVRDGKEAKRTAERGEMQDYYSNMRERSIYAHTFDTIKGYKSFLEEQYHIISSEWESIAKINSSEGGVEAFFDECKSTNQLFDRLLIPTVESSIAGHELTMFADMFERQHISFKNYKKLKATLEENKRIQLQLEEYVRTYEFLHKKEQDYLKTKQRVKGVWLETLAQKQRATAEQTDVIQKLEIWKKDKHDYTVKSASFDILAEKAALTKLENEYKAALAEQVNKEEELQQHRANYYSLRLAELKLEQQEQLERLKHIEGEIAKQKQTEELTNFESELEETKRALLGFFIQEIEKLEKEKQNVTYQLNPIHVQIEQINMKKKELGEKERAIRDILSGSRARINSRIKDLERLEQRLLANPGQEDVAEELDKWNEREKFLDIEIIRLQQEEKQYVSEEQEAEKRKEKFQQELITLQRKQDNIAYQLRGSKRAQEKLIQTLAALRPQWESIENIYLKQESIAQRLVEQIERLKKERQTLLSHERIAYRFVDDYGNQETFFGDAFLELQLASWKNQVDYLVTGVEYLQSMTEAQRERLKTFSLWPVTLVTTNKSKQQVIERVKHVADRLQFPITVITTEEALNPLDEKLYRNWIAPHHWQENIEASSFAHWKVEIGKQAQETKQLREEKEQEIKRWEEALKEFNDFLDMYSYEQMAEWKEEHSRLTNQLKAISSNIQYEKNYIEEVRSRIAFNTEKANDYKNEIQGLQAKIKEGLQYIQYVYEVEEEKRTESREGENLQQVLQEISQAQKSLEAFVEERNYLTQRQNALDIQISQIRQDEDYTSLQTNTPVYSGKSKKNIKEQMLDLEFKIRQINVTHGEWVAKRDGVRLALEQLDKQIHELLNEHSSYVDETRSFPGDGKQLLQTLWIKISSLKDNVEMLSEDTRQKMSARDKQKGKWETKMEQFQDDYREEEILSFTGSLEETAAEIRVQKDKLDERKRFIDQETARIEKELQSIVEAERGLERFMEGHYFHSPEIVAQSMISHETLDFTYNRLKFVQNLTVELGRNKEVVEAEQIKVEQAKRKFRDFCLHDISDIKLQRMAIQGVEVKQTYVDIMEFKKNMLMRIEKISKYAQEHIRQSDEELQLFINQIHAHLLTIVEELEQIPKKTKVKVLNEWKQIFTFTIPQWPEEAGKERIRNYIEWILEQLQKKEYTKEQGIQDEGKVRRDIETWLQTKQLLQMVMNNEVIKVSCRKVTNDNRVTSRSYSWEQSNVWSGGEKWSKNMTLFLGILNYVAEKKQHIQSKMKRHRAVILDNPFGKASSNHVLSPVFFIAEQLGFQIIALTAHAEGKFLQDYFPVIYSCRLRPSAQPNKQVMTKETWLYHAYFQDHDPSVMDRLGQAEQLALFE